jgi:hypothetical protein
MAAVAAGAWRGLQKCRRKMKSRAQKADRKCASGDEGALRRLEKASMKR